jgi:hypothetical protein
MYVYRNNSTRSITEIRILYYNSTNQMHVGVECTDDYENVSGTKVLVSQL